MPIKILVTIFCLYNTYKLILRLKDSSISLMWFIFWNIIWLLLLVLVWIPYTADLLTTSLGLGGKGIDLIVYLVVLVLVYGVFRITVKLEHLEYEITLLTRQKILDELQNEDPKKEL